MILAAKPIFRFKLRLVKLPMPGSINAKGKRAVYSKKGKRTICTCLPVIRGE